MRKLRLRPIYATQLRVLELGSIGSAHLPDSLVDKILRAKQMGSFGSSGKSHGLILSVRPFGILKILGKIDWKWSQPPKVFASSLLAKGLPVFFLL